MTAVEAGEACLLYKWQFPWHIGTMSNFLDINPSAVFQKIPCEEEWIPQDHIARFILAVVGQLDLSAFNAAYRGSGSQAYPPATLLGLLLYGYLTGVFSSRKIEAATYDSMAFRFLSGDTHPDHSSLATFRKRFQDEFKQVFHQVLLYANAMGLVRLGSVAVDGTKIQANASKHAALSFAHIEKLEAQLKAQVVALLAEADKADHSERFNGKVDYRAEVTRREELSARLAVAKAKIEARAAERYAREQAEHAEKMAQRAAREKATGKKPGGRPPQPPLPGARPKDQINLTDEESRIMPKAGGGFVQAYNAQAAVDTESLLVMATDLTQDTNDVGQVVPMLAQLKEAPACLGKVTLFVADTGFCSQANLNACEAANVQAVIATKREHHHADCLERFTEPAPLAKNATTLQKMAHYLKTGTGRAIYALRKQTVEPVFGIIKSVMGFRQFSMRGLEAARNEWCLVCLAWNLKRLAVLRLQ